MQSWVPTGSKVMYKETWSEKGHEREKKGVVSLSSWSFPAECLATVFSKWTSGKRKKKHRRKKGNTSLPRAVYTSLNSRPI